MWTWAVLRGIRRSLGVAKAAKAPATAAIVRRMLDGCGDRLIDIRDRALLAFGLASTMRRSELVALQVEDLTETPDGLRVLIRRSKGDQEGQGQEIAIPRGAKLRPVEALQAWLAPSPLAAGWPTGRCPPMRWRGSSRSSPAGSISIPRNSPVTACVRAS